MRIGSALRAGFTLIEMITVLVISSIMLTIAGMVFSGYFQRVAAERAAQVFAQDLTLARTYAVRSQEPVVMRFQESSLWYSVETQDGATEVARRRFGSSGDITLTGLNLDVVGDSLLFDSRGMADLSGAGGSLGTATFSSGGETYTVSFNGMGASKIERN